MTATTSGCSSSRRIFFSVGEPSGDLHGANLIRALKHSVPDLLCEGFGGDRMKDAGCTLHYPLCNLSLVGFFQVAGHIRHFFRLLAQATDHWKQHRPDAVVLIDYPGFNWWVAKRAKELGIPVFYFVPPQIWGWASWRVRKMRRSVDHVLCTLPFERGWYKARGIDAPYIGHPYFDSLHEQKLDRGFVEAQQHRSGRIIGILPGSRGQEIANNLTTQLQAAAEIHRRQPDTRFLIACYKEQHAERCVKALRELFPANGESWSLPVEVHVSRTPEIIHLAHSIIAVSGSVSLELLFARKPAVILYRAAAPLILGYRLFRNVKYVSLVNLLANRPLYPEYVTSRYPASAIASDILNWLTNAEAHQALIDELDRLRTEVAKPGACERAADYILDAIKSSSSRQVA